MELELLVPGLTCASQLYHLSPQEWTVADLPAQSLCLAQTPEITTGACPEQPPALSLLPGPTGAHGSPVAQVHSLAASEKWLGLPGQTISIT